MFDLEKFKTGEYYVHLPTQELYDGVMEFLEKNKLLWLDGDDPTSDNRWFEKRKQTCIRYGKNNRKCGLVYSSLDYYETEGYERLDINEYEIGGTNMNEKMKRDLIKLLFEKEYSDYERTGMYSYKGRIITDYLHRTARFVDFIDKIKDDYGIKGHEVADIIIKEFDLKEYSED